jgi:hypothetical protein
MRIFEDAGAGYLAPRSASRNRRLSTGMPWSVSPSRDRDDRPIVVG